MKLPSKRLIVLLLLVITYPPPGAAENNSELSSFVERGMELWHVPGMAVAVVSSDEVQFQQGFGQPLSTTAQR